MPDNSCPLYHCALTGAPSLGASACSSRSSIICATLSISAQSMLCKPVYAGAKVRAHAVAARRHELFGRGRNNARRAPKSTVCAEKISGVMSEECADGTHQRTLAVISGMQSSLLNAHVQRAGGGQSETGQHHVVLCYAMV